MFKKPLLSAAALVLSTAFATHADTSAKSPEVVERVSTKAAPPADHKGQWWTHPRGCQYSRAGRPGETVWYLIVNTARKGCPPYIVSYTPYKDVY